MKRSLTLWQGLLLLALACVAIAGTPFNPLNSSSQLAAKTYYVRTDGADAQKCTGLADAAYPGSGTNQACAWDHPFRALPPFGTPRIAGGDTLIIRNGAYRMGYGAPGAGDCDAGGAFDCLMPPIPSGPDAAHPTRILGANWNTGCSSAPQLWGAERPWYILNLTDSNNIELGCLEITDHSSCVENHSGALACERDDPPYGNWASYGLHAEDSSNVHLFDLNIHGLAAGGVHAGRIHNWTVERVRVNGNGSVGWDGDLWDDNGDRNSGALTFRNLTVEWNGCGETYPGKQPTGCWAQSAGGYGDGFATGTSGGNWLFEDSSFRFNTSDGLDLLYISEAGSSVTIRRSLFEGNAGNQVKNYRGPFTLENSIVIGNCGFFDGQPFTFNVDNCRALGTAVSIGLVGGGQATISNNTIASEGDCLVTAECSNGNCTSAANVTLRNNIFQGAADFLQPFEQTCLVYEETFPSDPFDMDYSIINDVKDDACPGAHDLCGLSPGLTDASIDSFSADLLAASPALDVALAPACPATDQRGVPRPQGAGCDLGALEYAPRVSARSVAASDGWILESTETSNAGATMNFAATTFNVGDDASDKQYRAVLSFDTASVPNNAVVVRVTLKIKKQGGVGTDAFSTHGGLLVDIRKGAFLNDAALQIGDFQAPAHRNAVGIITNNPIASWYSANFSSAGFALVNKTGITQLRLRFQKDDNDDGGVDYVNFFSGDAGAASRPQLIVEYYLP